MRKIKFRMWDGREMLYKLADQWVFWEDGNTLTPIQDNLILMQYTGMKDKNGKELFESDIVLNHWTCTYKKCGIPPIYSVIFRKGSFCYKLEVGNRAYKYVSNQYYPVELTKSNNWEIIGNIYEDSHLLVDNHELSEAK